ncbi:MAG TPA: CvpA family protein [Limnochordales bacterium]
MNWLDAVLVAGAALWMVRRYRRGFLSAALELGGAGLGLWLALRHAGPLVAKLGEAGGVPESLGRPVVFAALALPAAGLGHALGRWAAAHSLAGGSRWDRVAGAALGLGEATLVACVGLVAWVQWGGSVHAPVLMDSLLAGWLLRLAPVLYEWLSEVRAL